jgi:LmbE family N-acetylglucosaminyl deacetylase
MLEFTNLTKSFIRSILKKYAPLEILPLNRFFYPRIRSRIKELPYKRILIIAPHPDDEAIGMGGTISIQQEKGSEITIVYMTDGRHENPELGLPQSQIIEIRRREAQSIGREYNIDQIFWPIEDTNLTNDHKTVHEMEKLLQDIRPEVVCLPTFFESHYDHFAANKILVDALKISKIKINILAYEVWNNNPIPNIILDISSHFQKKLEILNHYKIPMKGNDYLKLCKKRNSYHYNLYIDNKSDGFAEVFYHLDSPTYLEMFQDYTYLLNKIGSTLPSEPSTRKRGHGLAPEFYG